MNKLGMNNDPNISPQSTRDYDRIASAIHFLTEHQKQAPSLEECANHIHLSPEHFQKLFTRWAGVSPKQFSQFLTKEYAKHRLQSSSINKQSIQPSIQETALQSGLSGSGRLYDLMIQSYGMTPGEYASSGESISIEYGFHDTPFGSCLLASTKKGICKLSFFDSEEEKQLLLKELHREWSLAEISCSQESTEALVPLIFHTKNQNHKSPLKLLLKGTHFQLQVWEALLSIPTGELCTYGDIAAHMGKPKSTRAASSAIAKNNIAWIIPCHRVIRQNGEFNQYRWHAIRKQAIIAWEASQTFGIN